MNFAVWEIVAGSWSFWPIAAIVPLYLYAQLRGDASSRAYASALAGAALLGTLLAAAAPDALRLARTLVGFDALWLVVHVVLCLRSKWLYPIVIAAAQLLVVLIEGFGAAGLARHQSSATVLFSGLAFIQLVAFASGLIAHRSRRPFWRVRGRPQNPSSDLAPRANGAR
jgi:hypothetical protein